MIRSQDKFGFCGSFLMPNISQWMQLASGPHSKRERGTYVCMCICAIGVPGDQILKSNMQGISRLDHVVNLVLYHQDHKQIIGPFPSIPPPSPFLPSLPDLPLFYLYVIKLDCVLSVLLHQILYALYTKQIPVLQECLHEWDPCTDTQIKYLFNESQKDCLKCCFMTLKYLLYKTVMAPSSLVLWHRHALSEYNGTSVSLFCDHWFTLSGSMHLWSRQLFVVILSSAS